MATTISIRRITLPIGLEHIVDLPGYVRTLHVERPRPYYAQRGAFAELWYLAHTAVEEAMRVRVRVVATGDPVEFTRGLDEHVGTIVEHDMPRGLVWHVFAQYPTVEAIAGEPLPAVTLREWP